MKKPYIACYMMTSLDSRNISWIAAGRERIDLARAVELLATEFGVERAKAGLKNRAFL